MAKKAMNFSSANMYHKWLAYVKIRGLDKKSPGNTPIKIRGKSHKVKH